MSNNMEWGDGWWKEKEAASLDRKARSRNASALEVKPGDSFLIVTEGTVTEPIYFKLLLDKLKLPEVKIHVQPGDASDPRHVIETASRLAKDRLYKAKKKKLGNAEPAKFDHIWAVVDTDVAVRMGFWNEVTQLADARNVKLVHSTPCIEFWFLLHLVGYTTRSLVNGAAAKSAVKDAILLDYSTNKETAKNAIAFFIEK